MRWRVLPLFAALAGILEAGAAAFVFALVTILSEPTVPGSLPVLSRILELLPADDPQQRILWMTLLTTGFFVFKNLALVGLQYLHQKVLGESVAHLSAQMLRGYMLLPYPVHHRKDSATLMRNTTHSVGAVSRAMDSAQGILLEFLVGMGIMMLLLAAAPVVALVTAASAALFVLGTLALTRRMAERQGGEEHEIQQAVYETLQNAFGGIREIKVLARELYFLRRFEDLQRRRIALGYRGVTLNAVPQLMFETAFVCAALVFVAVAVLLLDSGPAILPLLGVFAYAGFRVIPMATRITWRLNLLREAGSATAMLYDDFLLISEAAEAGQEDRAAPVEFRESIELDDVSYRYGERAGEAVARVSATIRNGEVIGIVGPTGAGKSTLVDLIVGLLSPTTGTIRIDGTPLPPENLSWRRRIGYVPQSIYLLNDSIRRNVALGIPDAQIDEARVRDCLDSAQLLRFADALPDGLDTLVGERGVRLSGGERQRLGIARALYHDPSLLVLDEATASLDTVTEAEVTKALHQLHGTRTILVIAHRLTTVRACDRILLMDAGRITRIGSYDELKRDTALFRKMAEAGT
jgi:ATP-binding cassette, subfamily B, bacterial PglK